MDSRKAGRNWISKEKIYKPINKGGLNCINMEEFMHAIRLNWMHRYITLNHNDFWTSLLDSYLDTTPTQRKKS